MRPVGCHGIGTCNGTQRHSTLVGALITHHANALHGQQDYAGLPNLVVKVPVAQSLNENVVGILQYLDFFACDVAENAHGKTRSRERMARYQMLRHSELTTHAAHLVLEQQAQRLAKLQIHLFRQSAYIVMALDDSASNRKRLDAVGIYSALSKPFHILNLAGLLVEHVDESLAYYLAFALRLSHSCKLGEEFFRGIYTYHVQTKTLIIVKHVAELVLAQHSVVDEYAGKILTYGAVEQHGRH